MKKKPVATKKGAHAPSQKEKRGYLRQTEVPVLPLAEALRLAQSLHDDFAGGNAAPHQLAMAVDLSPTAQTWKDLSGASIAYGLTLGGSQASTIALSDLGKRIVAPTQEGQDTSAKVEAALQPRILRLFFDKYNHAKFPQDKIALNVLGEMSVPKDRLERALDIIKRNGEFVGIIQQTKTGPFVAIDTPLPPVSDSTEDGGKGPDRGEAEETSGPALPKPEIPQAPRSAASQRVFITHGKNKEIVGQLKDLLTFGKFVPVVADEHETTSKPVPERVLDDMRSCFAGIIHVASEEAMLDDKGAVHHRINQNVLIEIGAAMALFGTNFILLVQRDIHLPSNLQGLYKCLYDGDKLDYEATMKLLKAFSEFK